jgi:hypothetical protein
MVRRHPDVIPDGDAESVHSSMGRTCCPRRESAFTFVMVYFDVRGCGPGISRPWLHVYLVVVAREEVTSTTLG